MGIKENFSQAIRELSGSGKDEKHSDNKTTVAGMRNAVAAEDTSEFMAVGGASEPEKPMEIDEFEEIERRAAQNAEEYSRKQNAFEQAFSHPEQVPQPEQPTSEPLAADTELTFDQQQNAESRQYSGYPQSNGFAQPAGGFNQSAAYSQSNYTQSAPNPNPQPSGNSNSVPPQTTSFTTATYRSDVDDNETTIISKNTVIDGNIRSFANMSIDGNIKGNVETTKDIDLNGKVVGDIACNNATLRTSQVQGNVRMKGNAFMERDTLLIGDLTSTYANVNGKIKGNLGISGKAELKSDAVVFGDISASTITVNDGAIIQGYVSTTFLNKEESKNIFPDAITIGE